MSLSSITKPNNYELYCLKLGDIDDRTEDIWLNNINGQPYPQGAGFAPVPVASKFLRTTAGPSPTMFWGDVNASSLVHGPANSILQTNPAGTAAQWNTNLTVPGNATVNGETTTLNLTANGFSRMVNGVSIDGNLQFNNISGAVGSFIKKTSANDQAFLPFELTDIPAGPNNRAIFTRSGVVQYSSIGPTDITPGAINTILQTNSLGQTAWVSNLVVPGNADIPSGTLQVGGSLTVDSNSSFGQNLNVDDSLTVANNIVVTTGDLTVTAGNLNVTAGEINAGTFVYGPELYFDTKIEGSGTIRAGNLLAPMWFLSVSIDINSGSDVLTLTTLGGGAPSPPLANFTFLAGTFTSALDGAGEVTLSGAISTNNGQAILSFWKNGAKVRSFYTPPPLGTGTLIYPINFSHPLTMAVGDTFYVTQTALSGGAVNLLGSDVNGNAQTTLQFKFLGF